MIKLLNVCGARPNFMKVAPLMRAFRADAEFAPLLVHTGQHYDEAMNGQFFRDLEIPPPDIHLDVGSSSHAVQTARIMERFEPVLESVYPNAVVVVGDVNSTLACALVAAKLGVPVFHVEAGLRSFDRSMPEEINRVVTDALSELLFATEQAAVDNLSREGIDGSRIHLVGNVMIDTLRRHLAQAHQSPIRIQLGLQLRGYALLTLHRPSNVDDVESLSRICQLVAEIAQERPVVFPVHPRTRARLASSGLLDRLQAQPGVRLLEPIGYVDFLKLTADAAVVLTDSGGVQEETTVLGVPCLTMRENTERPVTVQSGTNCLVGADPERVLAALRRAFETERPTAIPPLWDGDAAARIAAVIRGWYVQRRGNSASTIRHAGPPIAKCG